ncbi:MAG: hypothetical protein ACK4GT_00045 [Pararhodobacter sp.]
MRLVLATAIAATLTVSAAAMDTAKMSLANGLAEVIGKAETCGYEIDQNRLDNYFVEQGLDTPEALAWISMMADPMVHGDARASDCTLARATARSIGVLAQ